MMSDTMETSHTSLHIVGEKVNPDTISAALKAIGGSVTPKAEYARA